MEEGTNRGVQVVGPQHVGERTVERRRGVLAEQVEEAAVARLDAQFGREHDDAVVHAVEHEFGVVLEAEDGLVAGLDVGVDRQPHVQQDHLDEGPHRGDEAFAIVAEVLADRRQQAAQVLGVGTQIPLRREADALVDEAYAQAVLEVVATVVACGQSLEIGGLGALQPRQPLAVGQQAPGRLECLQVGVEAAGEVVGVEIQRGVESAQMDRVGFVKIEECLAAEHLGVAKLQLSRIRIQACIVDLHVVRLLERDALHPPVV